MAEILVALDVPTVDEAVVLGDSVREHVSGFKVGLELLLGEQKNAIERIAELGLPVFADAKLHDIPATVERSARQLGKRGARWVTMHLSGGREMVEAGVSGLNDGADGVAGVLGVTVLTSLDEDDLDSVGIFGGGQSQVTRLARLAVASGAEGVICSVGEVPLIKEVSTRLISVTPGIRVSAENADDQKRVATPAMALEVGSDFVVIGRAITSESDPTAAAAGFAAELSPPGPIGNG